MSENNKTYTFKIPFFYPIFGVLTAIIGHHIHNSIFWSIIDFLFAPLVWIKWFIFQEVTITIIKESFNWFLK